MFDAIRKWRRRRMLATRRDPRRAVARGARGAAVPRDLRPTTSSRGCASSVVLFLSAKAIVGARGHDVTPLQRVIIAIQACVLVLDLDLAFYDGFENVIVYPGEFVPDWEWEDEAGVVHRNDGAARRRGDAGRTGRAVVARRRGVSADWDGAGNESRHPRVRAQDRHAQRRRQRLSAAAGRHAAALAGSADARTSDFCARVDRGEDTAIDPYAAESPAEFFAVLSEVFFAEPALLLGEYPGSTSSSRVLPAGPGASRRTADGMGPRAARRRRARDAGANPKLTAAQMSEVKKYRAEGAKLHKAGKHQESLDALAKAEKILGVPTN